MKNELFGFARLTPALASGTETPRVSPGRRRANPLDVWVSRPLLAASSGGSGSDEKETIRAGRRRRTEPPGPEGRRRAEAPQREREEREAAPPPPRPPSGTGGGGQPPAPRPRPSGGMIPGGRLGLGGIVLIVVLFICVLALMSLFGPKDTGQVVVSPATPTAEPVQLAAPATNTPAVALPTPVQPAAPATNTPAIQEAPATPARPTVAPGAPSGEGTWLVMLYQDADDKILEQDIYVDLNEAERTGSSDRVHIVAQVDRFNAGYPGDGDWTSTRRFYITQDSDLGRVSSQQVADLGELNMSDGRTLADFVTWAIQTYPADKHALIMSDHGMGWPGGWSDPAPGGRGDPNIPLSARLGDELYLMELDETLGEIRAQTGLDKFDLIGLDACLMGHLEVLSALAPHARYAVTSQEVEPALGWAYTGFLEALSRNPGMDGAELSRIIVESYIDDDQRIVDDQARAEFLRQGSPMGGLFGLLLGGGGAPEMSPEQLAQQMGQGVTLAAVDLAAMPDLTNSVNDLAFALQSANQPGVARVRTFAQSFTSVFGREVPPSYIDLGHFAGLLKQEVGGGDLSQAADRVLAALDRAVIAEKHGPKKPGATGISIYFPNSQLYQSPVTGPDFYTAIARRFAGESLWDDFLYYHYTGRSFERAAGAVAVPERGTPISAPGTGVIQISPLTLSDDTAAPGRPVLLSADISGQNIGYIYLFVGFYDQAANSIFVADMDYLESAETREINGVYYPVWGEGSEFTIEFEWEPLMFAINDGTNSVVAGLMPQSYGASFEQAVYTVDGTYTYADGGESRYARLFFSNGLLRQVFGFTGEEGTGSPREIIPQPGDTFTVLERWMDLGQAGQPAQVASQDGDTLTFGDQMFTWEELDAAVGNYLVGFIVEDLDGNRYQAYEQVRVE